MNLGRSHCEINHCLFKIVGSRSSNWQSQRRRAPSRSSTTSELPQVEQSAAARSEALAIRLLVGHKTHLLTTALHAAWWVSAACWPEEDIVDYHTMRVSA